MFIIGRSIKSPPRNKDDIEVSSVSSRLKGKSKTIELEEEEMAESSTSHQYILDLLSNDKDETSNFINNIIYVYEY